MDALGVLQGQHALFFPENQGREGMVIYVTALAISLLGRTITAVRLPAALASVGTVLAVFWLGQVLFTERAAMAKAPTWRGLFVGGTAAGLLRGFARRILSSAAIVSGPISCRCFWRSASGFCGPGCGAAACGALRWAGIFTGLLVYTYLAARFTPLLLLALGLSFLWPAVVRPADLRRHLPLVAFYLAIAGLVALPLVVDFAFHPEYFGSRSSRLFIFDPLVNDGHPVSALISNLRSHIGVWGVAGDPNWRHNYDSRPLAQPPGGAVLLGRAAGGVDPLALARVPAAADLACGLSAPGGAGL